MAEDRMNDAAETESLDTRILRALQAAPAVTIPAGFAARVASQLPQRPALFITPQRYGRLTAIASLVILLGLMLACAPRATANSLYWLSIEFVFGLQFVLLTVWMVARRAGYTFPNFF